MIQRRNGPGLAREAVAEPLVDELDGDGPSETCIDGAKDFAHAALAGFVFHLVGSEPSAVGPGFEQIGCPRPKKIMALVAGFAARLRLYQREENKLSEDPLQKDKSHS